MSKQAADPHNGRKPCHDCLRAYRQCDILIVGSVLLSFGWFCWVIAALMYLA